MGGGGGGGGGGGVTMNKWTKDYQGQVKGSTR